MLTWIKEGKGSSVTLFLISILILSLSLLTVFVNDIRGEELDRILSLLETDGLQAYAVFGLIGVMFLGALVAQMFFISLFLHLVSKVIFRIPMEFDKFYKVIKIFYIFIGLGIYWQLNNFASNHMVSIIFNPFIILGFIAVYFLILCFANVNRIKPFLFATFLYGSYLIFTTITLGG